MYTSNNNNNNSCNYSPNSSSLFHIPSPNYSTQYEHELFQYFQQILTPYDQNYNNLDTNMAQDYYSNKETVINSTNKPDVEGGCKDEKGQIVHRNNSKGNSKKDRHSKINTANGPRDRRMRLSLDVAQKFFNLQDLLGFDKPSKTIEWLLNKSKSAVNELYKENCSGTANNTIGGAVSASSTSECEVISGTIYEFDIQKQQPPSSSNKEIKKKAKATRKATIFHPVVAKESRKQARDRARERTKIKKSQLIGEPIVANTTTTIPQSQISWDRLYESSSDEKHFFKENVVDDSNLGVTSNWSSTIFNYHHNSEISDENQFTNFQFCGKLWEA